MDIRSDKKGVCRIVKEVAKLSIKDRTELFQATAISMGMQPNVIEKDFWVCFMLDHLFHDCKYKNAFVFKGGTIPDTHGGKVVAFIIEFARVIFV